MSLHKMKAGLQSEHRTDLQTVKKSTQANRKKNMDWLTGFQFTLHMSFQSYQKRNPSQNCMLGAYNLHKYQITFSKTFQNTNN